MLATRFSRLLISATVTGLLLLGCKGHGSGSSIPQSLTNWTWESGADGANSSGYYTAIGTSTTTGQPAGRYSAMTWKDTSGNFWVFSGAGAPNDMWKFNTTTTDWTWVSGNQVGGLAGTSVYPGIYPSTPGTALSSNLPGQRNAGATWVDSSGNFWMFGGYGIDANGLSGYLNDLWSYNVGTGNWTWVSGSNQASGLAGAPVWGTQGVPSTTNQPNPRSNAAFWTGTNGMFYMLGGEGFLGGASGIQNDLWQYNPTTHEWTYLSGSQTFNASGVYGTLGTASASNHPGARHSTTTWVDSAGNLWLYGGIGYDSVGSAGELGDLWKYTPASGSTSATWTWVSGSSTVNNIGVYGTNAVASTSNLPGARSGASGWIDNAGNIWLFGGYGINYDGTLTSLNDLWVFTVTAGTWTWYNGSYIGGNAGVYGTYQSLSTTNSPGSRYYGSTWQDTSNNFWLFGGLGIDAAGTTGRLADLWKFYQ